MKSETYTDNTTESPLVNINEVKEGEPSSFFVYHGTDKPFVEALPSEKFPVVFYANTPEVATTYPFGYYMNQSGERHEALFQEGPYTNAEVTLAMKLLYMEQYYEDPTPGHRGIPPAGMFLYDNAFDDSRVIAVQKKLEEDKEFKALAERAVLSWKDINELHGVRKEEAVSFETGPVGSVKQYLIEAENPAVFDFQGHTWGDRQDEGGVWYSPPKWATAEGLRPLWDEWLQTFFAKGHDVVIIRNIRDVGFNLERYKGATEPHTIVAVSRNVHVQVNADSKNNYQRQ